MEETEEEKEEREAKQIAEANEKVKQDFASKFDISGDFDEDSLQAYLKSRGSDDWEDEQIQAEIDHL